MLTCRALVLPHFRFSMDHMLGPCCFTCQFLIGTHFVLSLAHVSILHWTMCHFFICPRGHFLFDHMSLSSVHVLFLNSSMWLDHFLPRVRFIEAHVSCPGYFTCNALVRPRVEFLFDHMGLSWFVHVQNIHFITKMIRKRHIK